jgi:signal transduction histidine kinase
MAEPFRRDRRAGLLGGVCAGLAQRLGVPVAAVRAVVVLGSVAGGIPVVLYLIAWATLPATGERRRPLAGRRATLEIAGGIALLVLAGLLLLRAWGLWVGDALVWPVTLVAVGAALIWRQSQAQPERAAVTGDVGARERREPSGRLGAAARSSAVLGAALILGGGLVFLWLNDALAPARDAALALLVVLVALAAIFAPFALRLWRGLAAERAERIRSQERAEVAAHLHDSVLQTLALVQRRADDPRAVATLARKQERELRAWLNGDGARAGTLAAALQAAAADVDEAHGTAVEVVTVGDRALDPGTEAVAAAAREALTNAAKFAPDTAISLYAEMGPDRVEVFVRDRGPGFDAGAVPEDRRGVRESIMGRMERHGGTARVFTTGEGTEWELTL